MTSRRQGQASLQHPRHHHHQPTRCPSSSRQPMLTTASNLANPNQFSTLVNVKLSPQPPPSWPYSDCLLCLRQVRPANDLHDHHLLCLLLWPEASYHHPLQNHPSSWSSRLWPPNRQSHRPSYLPQLRPPPWLSHRIYRPTASSYFCLRLNDFHGLGHKPPVALRGFRHASRRRPPPLLLPPCVVAQVPPLHRGAARVLPPAGLAPHPRMAGQWWHPVG